MKLLLTSEGLHNKSIEKAFFDMVGKKPEEVHLAYIPTAVFASESFDKRWLIDAVVKFNELKIGIVDMIDIATCAKERLLSRLKVADVIYVEGGNPFFLIESMRNSGLIEVMSNDLGSKVYVGASAGSMILGLKVVSKKAGVTGSVDGFGLVDFSLRPHFGRSDRPEYHEEKIKELVKEHKSTFYGIDDETAIKVVNGEVEVVSEGRWKKFELGAQGRILG